MKWQAHGVCAWMGVLLAGVVGRGEASPWGQPQGETLVLTRLEQFRAETDGRRFEQIASQTYAERGLPGSWTIGGKFTQAWQTIEQEEGQNDSRAGLVEAELFAQRPVVRTDRGLAALQVLYAAPTATQSLTGPEREPQRTDGAMQIGLMAGRGGERRFIGGLAGIRASLGDDAHQFRSEFQAGTRLSRRELLYVDINTTLSLSGGEPDGVDFSVISAGGSYVFPVSRRYRVQLGARTDIWADNVDAGRALFISLWYQR